jgi:nucleotidyltransferase substrate binding protein (TIGR01987 family)
MKSAVDVNKLIKAQATFEQFRRDMQDDRDQMGAVHAFKICYEIALKTMQAILKNEGVETSSPKDIFRQAFSKKIIDDVDIWFDFQVKRNLTAHVYEERNLAIIVDTFDLFSRELDTFIKTAQKITAEE